MIFETT